MLVREILEAQDAFPTVVTDTTVREAARVMRSADVRAVPVVEGERLLGIVTDWDIVDAFAEETSDVGDRPVSSIMTSEGLITIDIADTAVTATNMLQSHRVHHLLVTEDGAYRGVICLGLEWNEEGMLTPPVRPTLTARRP